MSEGFNSDIVELKNGAKTTVSEGLFHFHRLEIMEERTPPLLAKLYAVARGETILDEDRKALRRGRYLLGDDTLHPVLRDVLLSAYQETGEGPVLVNPFRFESEEQARAVGRYDDARWERLLRLTEKEDDEKERGPGGP